MKAKKYYSQNFLHDKSVVKKIIEAAEIKSSDFVLEIGPGKGFLTEAILAKTKKVVAVEIDEDLIDFLKDKFSDSDLEIINHDILSLTNKQIMSRCDNYKLVANLPYAITSPVLKKFLTEEPKPTQMIVMVQREVADRIVATPGKMSLLSVVCQIYTKPKKVTKVSKESFTPKPKVDSSVVKFALYSNSELSEDFGGSPEKIIKIAAIGFSSKRKQLQKNLSSSLKRSPEEVKIVLNKLKINEKVRAEELSIDDWVKLYKEIHRLRWV